MKKLFPEMPDVPQNVANRAVRIVEKHLKLHHASRVRDLPEEAKIRLYRDLKFFFEGGAQPPSPGASDGKFTLRKSLARIWEKIDDFLSSSEADRISGPVITLTWIMFSESGRLTAIPWPQSIAACE